MILGIELGSTRIKSVLINRKGEVLAQGSFEWENQFKNGLCTYDLEDVWRGLQLSYTALCESYGKESSILDGSGTSTMMHLFPCKNVDKRFAKVGKVVVAFVHTIPPRVAL